MSAFGLSISSQVCWPLVNCTINQGLLHAAPHSCGMCVVCHFPYKDQVNQFRAPFLTIFIPLCFYQNISESVADSHKFQIIIVSSSVWVWNIYQYNLLKFTWQWRHLYAMNKKVSSLFIERVFIPVFRYVKVIKIHQDFPELRLQMYCHLFMVHSVYR